MSDPGPDPTPAPTPVTPPPTPAPAPAEPPKPPPAPKEGTDWKTEARKWERLAKENTTAAEQLKALEDSQKSEAEKLTAKLTDAETEGADAKSGLLRLEVALDKAPAGMDLAKLRKLAERLRGTTREELEADAAELFADFTGTKPAGDQPTGDPAPPGAPKPDPSQGSRGAPPAARPTSLGQAVGAALARPKT